MGVLFVVDAIWMVLFSENLDRFSEKVRRGDLDLLLTKPVNSQFMMSFQKSNFAYVFNIGLSFGWLFWALARHPEGIPWARMPLLIVLIPCSVAIVYGIRFFFTASALIFTRAENINYLWYQIYRLGTRPDAIYPPWLRYAVLTFVPVGFLASVPARLLMETPDPLLFGATIMMAVICVWASRRFWKFALTFYSSASS
jgi:ABC-2 type transport system permease protein